MKKIIISILLFYVQATFAQHYKGEKGLVSFKSDAPLEVIQGKSKQLRGVIDVSKQTFAFSVDLKTFEGFNSPLQQEHFHENYLETKQFPTVTFMGKIIEMIDFQQDKKITVRAKGWLNIHGVKQERIIKSELEIKGNKLFITSKFMVLLREHNITIPKIVNQKIAEEISITVNQELMKMQ